MALSDNDWNRLDRMRAEDRDHLDAITTRLNDDSARQWQAIVKIDKELGVHRSESDAARQQPCQTAQALMGAHVKDSLTHNLKVAIPFLAGVIGLASTLGAWLVKVLHVKSEIKP